MCQVGWLRGYARFVVVLATNIREILDKAVLDRIAGTSKCGTSALAPAEDESFEFPLPSLKVGASLLHDR